MPSQDLYDRTLSTGNIYHLFNRGVAKQLIARDERDFQHLLLCLGYYMEREPVGRLSYILRTPSIRNLLIKPIQEPLVRIHAYCVMPNHVHIAVEQLIDGGISMWARRAFNSYSRYYNTRHGRVGPMFQGAFRFVPVNGDDQFLHLTRYIHLNPVVAKLVTKAMLYPWSSFAGISTNMPNRLYSPALTVALAGSSERYQAFVNDYADYATTIHEYQHLCIDGES